VERVLWWSHYFSKLVAPSIRRPIATGFLSLGGFEEELEQKQPAHRKNRNKILSCAFQMSMQKLFTGLHQTGGQE
jgi:hypothetical protein